MNDNDLSIVFQGPVMFEGDATQKCINSAKKFFPSAEVILSSWKGTDISNIYGFDKSVLSDDPGAFKMTLDGVARSNNTNRMMTSTVTGLKTATRPYSIKIRSDMYFENINCLVKFNDALNLKKKSNSITKDYVVSLSANNPYRGAKQVFLMSDWFEIGRTEDLLKFWDLPLQQEKDMRHEKGKIPRFEDNLIAESYLWTMLCRNDPKYADILGERFNPSQVNERTIELYEESIAENFVLFNGEQLGLNSYKLPNKNYVRRDFGKAACYTHSEWKKMYNKFVDHRYRQIGTLEDTTDIVKYNFVFKFLRVRFNKQYEKLKGKYNKKAESNA